MGHVCPTIATLAQISLGKGPESRHGVLAAKGAVRSRSRTTMEARRRITTGGSGRVTTVVSSEAGLRRGNPV